MLFSALILYGLVSLSRLPVELYPDVSFGRISIIVYIRGGVPPTEVESMVTRPVEEAVSTVSHLESILSISKEGESTVVLFFERGIDMRLAAMEVREKFAKVKEQLPEQAEKPIIAQFSQTDVPIVIFAVTSTKKTTEELRKIVDEDIKERMKRISGVANVEIGGGRERKIIIEVDKKALVRYGVSINKLIAALGASNLNLLTGEFEKRRDKILVRAMGQFVSLDDIKDTVVLTKPDGSVVRARDFAAIKDSYLDPKTYARINEKPIVSVYVQKESKANTIDVAKDIVVAIEELKTVLPEDLGLLVTKNQSTFIKKSIANLRDALLRGAILIIFVLMFFMGKFRKEILLIIPFGILGIFFAPDLWMKIATFLLFGFVAVKGQKEILILLAGVLGGLFAPIETVYIVLLGLIIFLLIFKEQRSILIVALSIPVSILITFGFMYAKELTINVTTLFGLALGVGMLVDNSIVVFENVVTKSEMGLNKIDSAIDGSSEMNLVILFSTLTTIVVFLPMIFISKTMSLQYGGAAWTVVFSLCISFFVAVMIVPLMSSKINITQKGGGSEKVKEEFLRPIYVAQEKALLFVLRRRFLVIAFAFGLFVIAWLVFRGMGKEFMGSTEQNRFTIFVELPTGAKLDSSDEIVKEVEDILREVPEVDEFTSRVEAWSSKIYVKLGGLTSRQRSVSEVIESLRPKVSRFQPAFIYFEEEQEVGTKEIILNIYGFDYEILREIAIAMTTRFGRIPYFTDTKIRMREGRPELDLKVDRKKAADFGFTTKDIADIVHAKIRGVRATMYHTEKSEVETIVRMQEKDRRTVKDVHGMTVAKKGDDRVLLDQVVSFEYGLGPSEIWRKNRARMIQVSSNIGEIPLGTAAKLVHKELSDLKLPEDYYYEIGGDYELMLKTGREFALMIIVVVILILLVLASMFESYLQPYIVIVTVLLATVGAIGALWFRGISVGIGAYFGMMMLAGIVVNNGIILVDHANHLLTVRSNTFRVLLQAARDRLRPVLMTTATTVFGLLPMFLDRSEGSNLWKPLATTVIGGLLFATPLTLVVVPAIYSIFKQYRKIMAIFCIAIAAVLFISFMFLLTTQQ
ncbi:MAG: efflux RND transporter permease subunit [Candidatus Omnitrophica bacterium]|nr:efflux RND transporter permease subunit [Candidatus Omnitrophota bacterium]